MESGWATVGTQSRIYEISLGLSRRRTGAGSVIVDEEKDRAGDGEDRECPRAPEAIQGAVRPQILDKAHGNKEEGVDLVLSGFLVVVQKPRPVHVAARPDFSVTPGSQE